LLARLLRNDDRLCGNLRLVVARVEILRAHVRLVEPDLRDEHDGQAEDDGEPIMTMVLARTTSPAGRD
jgi:hypothetical protein